MLRLVTLSLVLAVPAQAQVSLDVTVEVAGTTRVLSAADLLDLPQDTVDARDDYRVVYAVAELLPDFAARRIILARIADGQPQGPDQGPWRLIVEGELRPARWVRHVRSIRLRAAPQ